MKRDVATVTVLAILLVACGSTPPSPSAVAAASPSPSPLVISHESPAASDPGVEPSPSASAAPTRSPRAEATPGSTPGPGPKPPYRRGSDIVTLTDGLRLRSAPGVGEDSIKYDPLLGYGANILVREGPVKADGYWWYRVRLLDGLTVANGIDVGWLAAQDHDGEAWIGTWPDENIDLDPVPDPPAEWAFSPRLVSTGVEVVTRHGDTYVDYGLSIRNWSRFSPEVFQPFDDHDNACGDAPSRTRVFIGDTVDEPFHVYCEVRRPEELAQFTLPVLQGEPVPRSVFVTFWDRSLDWYVNTDTIDLPEVPVTSPSPGG